MSQGNKSQTTKSQSRREVLKGLCLAAALPASATSAQEPTAEVESPAEVAKKVTEKAILPKPSSLSGMDAKNIFESFHSRRLDQLSDAELPLVAPADRELARMQVVASAAAYEVDTRRLPSPVNGLDFGYRPSRCGRASRNRCTAARKRSLDDSGTRRRTIFQHLAKYTRACFDMCGLDPQSWRLYLSSAAKLSAIWIAETPREKIPDRFLDGRSTPG